MNPENSGLASSENSQRWLNQFDLGDRVLAEELLNELVLVSNDDFLSGLANLIIDSSAEIPGPIGLYVEREVRHWRGRPNRLFKESTKKPIRAYGSLGPAAVQPTKAYDPTVGSEGLVATLVTQLCRRFKDKFFFSPGPDKIRQKRIRALWLVTDFIGSGNRARDYIQAAWRVRSVRSWWSGKLVSFGVLAYSSTETGRGRVEALKCKPTVHHVIPCPTVDTSFSEHKALLIRALLDRYTPSKNKNGPAFWGPLKESLGFMGTGALIAFAHGMPNNCPPILHRASSAKNSNWTPLFPSRVTSTIDPNLFGAALSPERIRHRLQKIGQKKLSTSSFALNERIGIGKVALLLGALAYPRRNDDNTLCHRTGMTTSEVRSLCRLMSLYRWIDVRRRLTDEGHSQLRHARKQQVAHWQQLVQKPVGNIVQKPYYPQSLRLPV
jgi:hypothetical protein